MTFKKIASVLMAGALTLSLAMPAFASSATPDPNAVTEADRLAVTKATEFEIEMAGEVYTPVIRVQVLSKGAKMYINAGGGAIEGTAAGFGQDSTDVTYKFEDNVSVASTPILIRSDSDGGLDVNAKVTLTGPTGVSLVATSGDIDTSTTDKKLFVKMQGTDATNTTAANQVTDIDSFKTLNDAKISGLSPASSAITAYKTPVTANGICKIAAAKQNDGKIIPQYGALMLCGKAASKAQWGESDAISATVVLTFSGLSS